MTTITKTIVDDSEQVARIVSKEWVIGGVLMPQAFELAPKETYLSVNRTSIDSYDDDVKRFVMSHPQYLFGEGAYRRANLIVSDVRRIRISHDGKELQIGVEIEPRAAYTPSHAGIFVKSGRSNVILGRQLSGETIPEGLSTEMVLQKVQWELYDLAELQTCQIL